MTPPIVDSSLVNLVPSGTAVPEGMSEGTAVPYYFEVLQSIIIINKFKKRRSTRTCTITM